MVAADRLAPHSFLEPRMSVAAPHPSRPLGLVVATTSLGFLVVQLDVSIVNVALVRIGHTLGGGMASLQWVVDAYTLAFAAFLLSAGALGDRLGARRVFVLGLGVFGVASLGCALAPSLSLLIAARAVQGVGAALLMPCSLAVLNHACGDDGAARARALGLWTAAGGVALSAGPLVGGVLIDRFGWPSIFYINVPVCLLGMALAWRCVEETPRHRGDGFDLAGQACAVAMLLGLTAAVIEAGTLGWHAPRVWLLLGAGVLAGAAFLAIEARGRAPMLPLGLFRRRAFTGATVVGWVVNFALYGSIFVLSLYFQRVRGYSPSATGLAFLPFMATVTVANVAGSRLAARTGPRWPMVAGLLLGAAGFALLVDVDAGTGYGSLIARLLLIPAGVGVAVPSMTATVLSSAPRNRSALAAGVLNTVRQAAGAVGVAAFGALAAREMLAGMRLAFGLSAALLAGAGVLAARSVPPGGAGGKGRGGMNRTRSIHGSRRQVPSG
jgi:DHA2 family methylenomycin A resistance protein-like MFS transporter